MVRLGLWLLLLGSLSLGSPYSRYCGGQLADIIALVCQGRGYNMPLTPQIQGEGSPYERRFKRGIVDECCKRGCSQKTLESYCSPSTTQRPDNLQIRKRSEHSDKKKAEDSQEWINPYAHLPEKSNPKVNKLGQTFDNDGRNEEGIRYQKRRSFENILSEKISGHYNRVFYTSSEKRHQGSQYQHTNRPREKVKRKNEEVYLEDALETDSHLSQHFKDTTNIESFLEKVVLSEEKFELTPQSIPLRHHRGRKINRFDPKYMRQKESDTEGDLNTTRQIGTVSPYFLGRTLVLPSSSRKIKENIIGKEPQSKFPK